MRINVKEIPVRNYEAYSKNTISNETVERFYRLQDFLRTAAEKRPEVVVKRIYAFLDHYMEKNVIPYSACAKGCAHCCKVPVTLTRLEAAFIEWDNRKNRKAPKLTVPEGLFMPREAAESYCPHLDTKTATCKTYASRPFSCRVFASMDHWSECVDPNNGHQIYNDRSNEMLKILRRYLDEIDEKNGGRGLPDIRDFFGEGEPIR